MKQDLADKVKEFFDITLHELYDEDNTDSRSEDSKYYDAVEQTCAEFSITEQLFDEIIAGCVEL